jgi:hypothetical protein
MPQQICKVCKKEFYVKPCHLKLGGGIYCSRECKYQGQKTGQYIKCDICGKKAWKQLRDFKRSKSNKFFCSKTCQTKWRNDYFKGPMHKSWKGGAFTYRRIMESSKIQPICRICHNKDYRVLEVHHIDCDRKNNDIKNLVWLCCNCHCLVHKHNVKLK